MYYLLKNDMLLQKIPVMLRVRNTGIIYQKINMQHQIFAKYEATGKKRESNTLAIIFVVEYTNP